jgi:hypothetical protein
MEQMSRSPFGLKFFIVYEILKEKDEIFFIKSPRFICCENYFKPSADKFNYIKFNHFHFSLSLARFTLEFILIKFEYFLFSNLEFKIIFS